MLKMPIAKNSKFTRFNPYKTDAVDKVCMNSARDEDKAEQIQLQEAIKIINYIKTGEGEITAASNSLSSWFYIILILLWGDGFGRHGGWFGNWWNTGFVPFGGYFGCAYLRRKVLVSLYWFLRNLRNYQKWCAVTPIPLDHTQSFISQLVTLGAISGHNAPSTSGKNSSGKSLESLVKFERIAKSLHFFDGRDGFPWRACIRGCPCNDFGGDGAGVFEAIGPILQSAREYGSCVHVTIEAHDQGECAEDGGNPSEPPDNPDDIDDTVAIADGSAQETDIGVSAGGGDSGADGDTDNETELFMVGNGTPSINVQFSKGKETNNSKTSTKKTY